MFNGWPASYADIVGGLTFARNVADQIVVQLAAGDRSIAVLLGPSGVGKTTAARQVLATLSQAGTLCWEHKVDQVLRTRNWRELSTYLRVRLKTPTREQFA
jgi:ABC-type iron transport system FetAB ATPase subunit